MAKEILFQKRLLQHQMREIPGAFLEIVKQLYHGHFRLIGCQKAIECYFGRSRQ